NAMHSSDRAFGEMVLRSSELASGLKNRGIKKASQSQHSDLAVFKQDAKMACALLETGFISNEHDRSIIATTAYRVKLARNFWSKAGLQQIKSVIDLVDS